jgi:hypothetical protein
MKWQHFLSAPLVTGDSQYQHIAYLPTYYETQNQQNDVLFFFSYVIVHQVRGFVFILTSLVLLHPSTSHHTAHSFRIIQKNKHWPMQMRYESPRQTNVWRVIWIFLFKKIPMTIKATWSLGQSQYFTFIPWAINVRHGGVSDVTFPSSWEFKNCYRCCRRLFWWYNSHHTKREGHGERGDRRGVKTVGSATPPNANVSFCECRNGSPIGNYWQFPYKRHRLGFALRHNGRLRTRRSRARTHTKRRLNRTDPKLNEFWAVINLTETADPLPLW